MKATFFLTVLLAASPVFAEDSTASFSPNANEQVKAMARNLIQQDRVTVKVDRINGRVHVRAAGANQRNDYVELNVSMPKGEKPALFLHAVHCDESWIFAKSVDFKIGDSVITLKDDSPHTDVLDHGGVYEGLSWYASEKEVQTVIKAVLAGRVSLCALRGTRADRVATITPADFANVMTVYFALGGEPLKQ